jgi:hypothetical protein
MLQSNPSTRRLQPDLRRDTRGRRRPTARSWSNTAAPAQGRLRRRCTGQHPRQHRPVLADRHGALAARSSQSTPTASRPRPTGRACGLRRTTSAPTARKTPPRPTGAVLGARHVYKPPAELRLNQWALTGARTMEREAVVLDEAEGTIAYRLHARDVNVVMGPSERNTPVRFLVRLDGQPPGAAHGVDVDEQGRRQGRRTAAPPARPPAPPVGERTVEITFSTPASTRTRSPSAKRGHGHLGREVCWLNVVLDRVADRDRDEETTRSSSPDPTLGLAPANPWSTDSSRSVYPLRSCRRVRHAAAVAAVLILCWCS